MGEVQCSHCKGSGKELASISLDNGQKKYRTCPVCKGAGSVAFERSHYTEYPDQSLQKAQELMQKHGKPVEICIAGNHDIRVVFSNGAKYILGGFTVGYRGTGPDYTKKFLNAAGFDISIDEIAGMEPLVTLGESDSSSSERVQTKPHVPKKEKEVSEERTIDHKIKCRFCGLELPKKATFCASCGKKQSTTETLKKKSKKKKPKKRKHDKGKKEKKIKKKDFEKIEGIIFIITFILTIIIGIFIWSIWGLIACIVGGIICFIIIGMTFFTIFEKIFGIDLLGINSKELDVKDSDIEKEGTPETDLANILNNVKELVFEQGRFEEAAKILEKAAELYPNSAPVQFSLGVTYSKIASEYKNEDIVRSWALKSCEAFKKAIDLANRFGELNDEQLTKARKSVELIEHVKKINTYSITEDQRRRIFADFMETQDSEFLRGTSLTYRNTFEEAVRSLESGADSAKEKTIEKITNKYGITKAQLMAIEDEGKAKNWPFRSVSKLKSE